MTYAGPADIPPPAPPEYDSGAAAFHAFSFANRNGWGALVLPGIVYVAGYLAFSLLIIWAAWPFMEMAMTLEEGQEPDREILFSFLGRMGLVYGVSILFYLVIWSIIEAALLRWLYGRGMTIRFGGAELMLIVIALFWIVLPIALFVLPWALAIFAGETESAPFAILCALAFVVAIPVWIMLAVRFAPAGALTVHDRRLHLFSAWRVSRGCFWPVLGAFVIAVLVYLGAGIVVGIVQQILFLIGGAGAFMAMFATIGAQEPPDPRMIIDMFTSPLMIAMMVVMVVISAAVAFLFQVMFAGINVYGVKRLAGAP
jgi:hypothetical protein